MEGDVPVLIRNNIARFISIHSLRMEGDDGYYPYCSNCHISIHSLRMEGDID